MTSGIERAGFPRYAGKTLRSPGTELPSASFWEMAARESTRAASAAGPSGGLSGLLTLSQLERDLAARTAVQVREELAEPTHQVESPTLEEMLRAKYPRIAYHVCDAGSPYWRTRNDYPHYLLYRQDADLSALENWEPVGPNPFYGSVDGKFIAPKEIKALGSIPPGSKAVVIHPKVQQRMEEDPAYAREIMERIDTWFTFDAVRNEAMMPGISARSSQCVAIGEDGSIVNAQSFSHGEITCSGSAGKKGQDWWTLRMARYTEFMRLLVESRLEDAREASRMLSASAARARLGAMLRDGRLEEIFGDTIAGVSTASVLALAGAHCGLG